MISNKMHALNSMVYLNKMNIYNNIAMDKVSSYEIVLNFVNKRTKGRTNRIVVVIIHQSFFSFDKTILLTQSMKLDVIFFTKENCIKLIKNFEKCNYLSI